MTEQEAKFWREAYLTEQRKVRTSVSVEDMNARCSYAAATAVLEYRKMREPRKEKKVRGG